MFSQPLENAPLSWSELAGHCVSLPCSVQSNCTLPGCQEDFPSRRSSNRPVLCRNVPISAHAAAPPPGLTTSTTTRKERGLQGKRSSCVFPPLYCKSCREGTVRQSVNLRLPPVVLQILRGLHYKMSIIRQNIHLRLPRVALQIIDEIAAEAGATRTQVICFALQRHIRRAASAALREITGVDFGCSHGRWREWHRKSRDE